MLCIHQPRFILFNKVHNLPNKGCSTLKLIFPITDVAGSTMTTLLRLITMKDI